eukprot:8894906-Alexandrium_andersonii.AAC.1
MPVKRKGGGSTSKRGRPDAVPERSEHADRDACEEVSSPPVDIASFGCGVDLLLDPEQPECEGEAVVAGAGDSESSTAPSKVATADRKLTRCCKKTRVLQHEGAAALFAPV